MRCRRYLTIDTGLHYTCYRRRLNSICPTMYITGWLTSWRGTPTALFSVYAGDTSSTKKTTAGIIQGSIGPAAYVVTRGFFKEILELHKRGGLGDRSPPAGSRGGAPIGGLGDEVPPKLKHYHLL